MHIDNKLEKIKVLIKCMVFNHEAYLRKTLEGFVMQKTDFRFIALVHDDASNDGSAKIIREFANKYPDIIKPMFESENQYSKKASSLARTMNEAMKSYKPEYIAICEGDDYWIDPLKLQKQVDFLESHPDYGLVHTNLYEANWRDGFKEIPIMKSNVPEGYVYKDILQNNFISTLTAMFRAEFLDVLEKEVYPIPYWDRITWICLSRYTKFHYIPDRTGVYRIVKHSATHGDYKKVLQTDIKGTEDLLTFLRRNNFSQEDLITFYLPRCQRLLKYSYFAKDKKNLKKYWTLVNNQGTPNLNDYLYWIFGILKIPIGLYSLLGFVKKYISTYGRKTK